MPANHPNLPATPADPEAGTPAGTPGARGAHRRIAGNRNKLYRGLTVGLLATSLAGAAVAGTLLNGDDPRNASATADAAASADRTAPAEANRGYDRSSPSASASPSPSSPAPKPSTASPKATRTSPKAAATTRKAAPVTKAPVKPAAPVIPAGCSGWTGVRLTACTILPEFGLSYSQMPALDALWEGESNWNVYATNPSSGAYGIPQSLPAEKMATAGSDWRTNPATQIRWGLGYIVEVYGTPSNALAQWEARWPHWY